MGRPKGSFKIPKYRVRRVKTKNGTETRACAEFSGRTVYFPGEHGSEESRGAYERAKAEWFARGCGRMAEGLDARGSDITIRELCAAYMEYCKTYYQNSPGSMAAPRNSIVYLVSLYGDTLARDFRGVNLMGFMQHLIDTPRSWGKGKRSRNYVNRLVRTVKLIFRWAKTRDYVAPSVYHALQDVEPLIAGRSAAAERPPVRAVPDHIVEKTLPFLRPHYRAMVQIQRLTKARAGEICCMRARDIDMTSVAGVWLYRPMKHKGQWRGKDRVIAIGPQAQAILAPFLKANLEAFIWDPRETERDYIAARQQRAVDEARKYKGKNAPSNKNKYKRKKRIRQIPDKRWAPHVTVKLYQMKIKLACIRADAEARQLNPDAPIGSLVPRWTTHQLRHVDRKTAERAASVELAPLRAVLGHTDEEMTKRYVDPDLETAINVMRRIG